MRDLCLCKHTYLRRMYGTRTNDGGIDFFIKSTLDKLDDGSLEAEMVDNMRVRGES